MKKVLKPGSGNIQFPLTKPEIFDVVLFQRVEGDIVENVNTIVTDF